jgi:hypothetical protein
MVVTGSDHDFDWFTGFKGSPRKPKAKDYALAEGPDGGVLVHRVDCPVVRAQASRGEPVMNMFDCQGDLPKDLKRHSCLDR